MCHSFYAQDGGENHVFREEARILRAHGEEVEEYVRHNEEMARYGAPAKARAFAAGLYSRRTAREVSAIVRAFRPQVAIVQNVFPLISPSIYRVLHALRVPVVQLVFNYRFLCPSAQLFTEDDVCQRCLHGATWNAVVHRCIRQDRVLSAWYAAILGLHRVWGTFRQAITRFVVPHPFVGRKLVEGGFSPDRIRVNANPYQLPAFAPRADSPPYLLYVGRVVPEKGLLTLMEALSEVPPPLRVEIVGDGSGMGQLRAYLAERPDVAARVTLRGTLWGEDLRALEEGAFAYVLPSRWFDPSPLLLYNALSRGKPALATEMGSQPEIVTDGVDGLIFRAGDARDLAAKIRLLIERPDLCVALGRAGRLKAETHFTPEAHYRRLRSYLDEAAAETA